MSHWLTDLDRKKLSQLLLRAYYFPLYHSSIFLQQGLIKTDQVPQISDSEPLGLHHY